MTDMEVKAIEAAYIEALTSPGDPEEAIAAARGIRLDNPNIITYNRAIELAADAIIAKLRGTMAT